MENKVIEVLNNNWVGWHNKSTGDTMLAVDMGTSVIELSPGYSDGEGVEVSGGVCPGLYSVNQSNRP